LPKLSASDEFRIAKGPRNTTLCAHGAKINRSVSPATGVVDPLGWGATQLALPFFTLKDPGMPARCNQALAKRIATSEQVPKHLSQRDLTLLFE
jgi:hypothetical protein